MKLKYRPEIDGLRAIAVGAIILYHAQFSIFNQQIFKGGFFGVDIFFVISGYLISLIILKELIKTGSFSFKYFYERRIRRIMPALLFVVLASLPFAWLILLNDGLLDFSKSILSSLGFISNYYFHYSGQQYGAESGLLKPFLHTWSLSIEEQFYILFPTALLIIFKFFRKNLHHILVFGLIISLLLANWGSVNYPSASFYFIHTRMWEFLAGSILAYFEIILGYRNKNKILELIFPFFGFCLIGHSFIFFNDEILHPSFFSLSPIIGVCLLIWFTNKNELITKILSSKLFVSIGLISYSLYLWHYPIFAFARVAELTKGIVIDKFILIIVIFVLSVISYYLIEKPSRNRNNKFRNIIIYILISISTLFFSYINFIQKDWYKFRLPEIIKKNNSEKPWNLLKNSNEEICWENLDGCKFNTSSNKKVYIIGDSHAASLTYNLKNRLVEKDYQFITSTRRGCFYFPGFDKINIKKQKIKANCTDDYFQKIKQTLLLEKNSIIIFGGRLPVHLSNFMFDNQEGGIEGKEWKNKFIAKGKYKNIQSSFKNEILKLSKNNKVILIYPIPEVGWNLPSKLFNSLPDKADLISDYLIPKNFITTSFNVYKKRTKSSFELLDSIEGKNIHRVYPHALFCDTTIKNRCTTHDDKNMFYIDDNHPSSKGAEMINDLILNEIKKIETINNN